MRRLLLALALILVVPTGLQAQRTPADDARRAEMQARRDSLEKEVAQRFLDRLTKDLALDSSQREHTERVMKRSGVRRSELMRRSGELRGRLYRALRNDATTDADFQQLLAEHESLRAQEHNLWRQDQAELAAVLTPRQRVQFIISWARFQQSLREIMSQRSREESPLH